MTGTSVEWNGLDLRILRGYGVLAPHYEFWLPSAGLGKLWSCLRTAGATPVGCASLEKLRIAEGIPAYGVDMVERDLPQETSQMRALHFNKGCYLGQEIVERIRSRGNVHRHLRPLELTGPVPESGTELFQEDGNAGRDRLPARRSCRWRRAAACLRWAWCARKRRHANQAFAYTAGAAQGHGAAFWLSRQVFESSWRLRNASPGSAGSRDELGHPKIREFRARSLRPDWKPGAMSDTPKFEVIDRRKMKAEEEQVSQHAGETSGGGRGGRRRAHRLSPAAGRGWW